MKLYFLKVSLNKIKKILLAYLELETTLSITNTGDSVPSERHWKEEVEVFVDFEGRVRFMLGGSSRALLLSVEPPGRHS